MQECVTRLDSELSKLHAVQLGTRYMRSRFNIQTPLHTLYVQPSTVRKGHTELELYDIY